MKLKSSKAGKQRKALYGAPLKVKRNSLASHLSKDLAEKYKKRAFAVKVGDEVEVMRGEFRGKKGKISRVNLKNFKVYIEGVVRKKVEGTERMAALHPSNLRIVNLSLEDKRRTQTLEKSFKPGEESGSKEIKSS